MPGIRGTYHLKMPVLRKPAPVPAPSEAGAPEGLLKHQHVLLRASESISSERRKWLAAGMEMPAESLIRFLEAAVPPFDAWKRKRGPRAAEMYELLCRTADVAPGTAGGRESRM